MSEAEFEEVEDEEIPMPPMPRLSVWAVAELWAKKNARLLLLLVMVLFIPYFFLCFALAYGLLVAVANGGCGG